MRAHYLTPFLLALVFGCSPKADTPVKDGAKPVGGQVTTDVNDLDKPVEVPDAVKTDAFEYYGLANPQSMDVELKAPDQPVRTGGVSVKFEKAEGGKATFKVTRTGAVQEVLGDNDGYADATGVYMTGTSIGKITPDKFLALPADLTPGKTWTMKNKIEATSGQTIEEDSTYRVEGERDVKTKSGTQKALLVTSTGTATVTQGGTTRKDKYETKSWYVKGVGPVRFEIILTEPGKAPKTIVVTQDK